MRTGKRYWWHWTRKPTGSSPWSASSSCEGETAAQFAIVVADACRGEGIGRHLMERLIEDAEARGLRWIEGIVLRDNQDMKRLLRPLGFHFKHHADDPDVFHARIDLPREG
ncbi:MAG: GNAT family N-acetyltransferase [Gammaproteobacteria bacterium]|nr:GNAT family N-acetyltransferase [Gammaproteobacteria bacterium]